MRFLLPIVFLLFITAAVALADPIQADLPITRVTLYTSGVGYFERSGFVDGDTRKTLLFPIGQVNDVLKSLVLLDLGGGSIRPVTYGALDPVSKQLQSFSVDVSDNPDRATLLNRLRGASVTVTLSAPAPQTLTGVVVGVENQIVSLPNNGTTQQSTLNLLADDGMHSLPLASITSFQVNDPGLRTELRAALATVAQGRDASKRPVTLDFAGRGKRNVIVGYLTETPLWQTSYRLVLGKTPQIQGWALVQNTGQDDWSNVTLSLVSGRPISFIQDLYTPTYVPRQVVQANVVGSPTPQTYGSNLDEDVKSPDAGGATAAMNPNGGYTHLSGADENAVGFDVTNGVTRITAAQARRPPTGTTYTVSQKDEQEREPDPTKSMQIGGSLFAYDIRVPVTVPRQQSAMIPFIGGDVSAQTVSIYNQSTQPDHPLSGVQLKNTTGLHLMGGPLTVFDTDTLGQTRYVGDALIDDTEPNQIKLLSYAVDLAVDADVKDGDGDGQNLAVTFVNGVLQVKSEETASRIYTFKNNATQSRLLVVEDPNRGEGWSLIEPAKPDERTKDVLRFDVPLASKQSKTFKVVERNIETSDLIITNLRTDTLVSYSQEGEVSAAVKSALHEIVTRRNAISETQRQIVTVNNSLDAIATDQDRIRKNMGSLDHASALYKRYVTELDAQETRLAELKDQRDALNQKLIQQQTDLADYVGKLNLE